MNKGIALSAVIYSVASGLAIIVTGLGISFASSTTSTLSDVSNKLANHDTEISQLKNSECVQNENIRNLAMALKASFVSDPNCQR